MSKKLLRFRWLGDVIKYTLTMGLFIGAAAFALILARGNTITEEGLAQTGTIRLSIDSTEGVEVYLNEQKKSLTSNRTIEGVLPGTYQIRVFREGYSEWFQQVRVYAGLVSDVGVQLFANELRLELFESKDITQVFFSDDRTRVFYTVTASPLGTNIGLWQKELSTGGIFGTQQPREVKISNLTSRIASISTAAGLEIIPSPDNRKLLLVAGSSIHILDQDRYNEPNSDNQLTLPYPTDNLSWLKDSNSLLIRSGNLLIDYTITDSKSTIISYNGESLPVYTSAGSSLYFMRSNELWKYSGSGISSKVELNNINLPAGITQLYGSENPQNLVLKAQDGLFFLNLQLSYLQNLGIYNLLAISPSAQNLLVKRGDEPIKSVDILISQVFDSVNVVIEDSSLPSTIITNSIKWANNQGYFVFMHSDNTSQLNTADRLGNNLFTAFQANDQYALLPNYSILPDNTGLLVLIQDKQEGKTNIYRLLFSTKQ